MVEYHIWPYLHTGEAYFSLLKNINITSFYCGPGRLRSHWEDEVYIVVDKRVDVSVYTVRPESGEGEKRVLHRNPLLPCDFIEPTNNYDVIVSQQADSNENQIKKKSSTKPHNRKESCSRGNRKTKDDASF